MTNELIQTHLSAEVLAELREAKSTLEHHGLADRLTELLGAPITGSIKMLPDVASGAIHGAIDKALAGGTRRRRSYAW
jgi:hypothetical protein